MSLKKKYLSRQIIYEEFKPLNQLESESFRNAMDDIQFKLASSFTDQIGILCRYLRKGRIQVSYERIGKIFHKTRFCVLHHHKKFLRGQRKDGRPLSLNADELEQLKEEILRLHSLSPPTYPTYEEILDYIKEEFGKDLYQDTFRKLVLQQLGDIIRPCIAKPIDENRMDVDVQDIEHNYLELRRLTNNIPMQFCFNIDEMGHTDFSDAPIKTVLVPYNFNKLETYYPVERSVKRASVIACISPAGLVCEPQFAIEDRCTIDVKLFDYIPYESLQIVGTNSGFINTDSFLKWLNEIFLPKLHYLREKYSYNGTAVIITDGLLAHSNAFDQIDLQREKLVVHYLEPHSSDQTQPLDLGIFGGMKKFISNFKNKSDLSPAGNQILKIFQALRQMCSPLNCRAAFKATGLITNFKYINGHAIQTMGFDATECCKVRGYEISYIKDLLVFK